MQATFFKKHLVLWAKYIQASLLCFCFLFANNIIQAQSKDSLLKVLQSAKAQAGYQSLQSSVALLNTLSSKYMFNNPDSAVYFGREALRLATTQQYPLGQSRSFSSIAKGYYIKGSYDSSLIFSEKARHISEDIHDSLGIAMALNNIGLIYLGHDEYAAALKQFNKALVMATIVNNSSQRASDIFNIGICYDELHDATNARNYLNLAIKADSVNDEHHITVMAYNRMGKVFFNDGRPEEALGWYKKVLDFAPYRDNWELTFAFNGMAESYYALGKYHDAINNGLQSVAIAKQMSAKWDAEQALRILAKSYAAAGDYKNAYAYEALDRIYKDSLDDEAKVQVINYMKLRQKEIINEGLVKEDKLNKEKIHLTRVLNICISIFAMLLVAALVLLYINYKRIAALNKQLVDKNTNIERLNVMKDQLFAVVSHDLRGPMGSLEQTLELVVAGGLSQNETKFLFESLHRQVNMSNQMLNNLLAWAATQRKGITTQIEKVDADVIVREVLGVFEPLAAKKEIDILYDNANAKPLLADSSQLRIILQNLVSNAVKFTPVKGSINIFYSSAQQQVSIHIHNTGADISAEKQEQLFKSFGNTISTFGTAREKGAGIGLMIVKEFVEQNNGKLAISSEEGKGVTFSVSLPVYTGGALPG